MEKNLFFSFSKPNVKKHTNSSSFNFEKTLRHISLILDILSSFKLPHVNCRKDFWESDLQKWVFPIHCTWQSKQHVHFFLCWLRQRKSILFASALSMNEIKGRIDLCIPCLHFSTGLRYVSWGRKKESCHSFFPFETFENVITLQVCTLQVCMLHFNDYRNVPLTRQHAIYLGQG